MKTTDGNVDLDLSFTRRVVSPSPLFTQTGRDSSNVELNDCGYGRLLTKPGAAIGPSLGLTTRGASTGHPVPEPSCCDIWIRSSGPESYRLTL